MKINPKYHIPQFTLKLNVIEAFDFSDAPILLLEQDGIGNFYLSYLTYSDPENDIETRSYLQISKEKLQYIFENKISVYEAFSQPENGSVYVIDFDLHTGNTLNAFLIPTVNIAEYNLVPDWYDFEFDYSIKEIELNDTYILNYSEKKQNLILDFYLQSENLVSTIKPYAFFKVFKPLVDIIKDLVGFDNRNADQYLEFSNLRQASLGITIEINYSKDLFLEKEDIAINTVIELLNAQTQEDFRKVVSSTANTKYIKEYSSIIKTVIANKAVLNTAYANPITKEVKFAILDEEKARIAKSIIDEEFEIIEDIEVIEGIFREINIEAKEPSFKIYSSYEEISIRGKFEISILEKIKSDYVNIGKESYKFTIKTIYYPETTVKSEAIKRYLIDYELIK
ncbi:hypothetical protein M2T70_11625 [Elizabethkingia anophelis]|uniref:DUF6575 domain-containing protein n=1 Tax=Elizabethkingia anophelis TaxID=1117645 RepID=UPI000994E6CF|nr:DUF6575 domain-containing protein [Elizabethkingia anophelis]AQW99523.1 hypothetical protein BBD31_17190 [Elizabethkingia anophelis]AQX90063.1 hypothetical protein AYC67_13985 [Elizabethkingia anophelis]ASV79381.1 hypothetical protein A6J37_12525 [Elizabethkingia anophelis]EHM7980443.1 hypothetical protein [Elizabethkingia anophelis]EHM8031662.1 hypothetical protein [Elizabethkingia anophelis]